MAVFLKETGEVVSATGAYDAAYDEPRPTDGSNPQLVHFKKILRDIIEENGKAGKLNLNPGKTAVFKQAATLTSHRSKFFA